MQFLSHHAKTSDDYPALDVRWALERYQPWDHDCTFEFSFKPRSLRVLEVDPEHIRPYEVVIDGGIGPGAIDVKPIFDCAAAYASDLSEFGEFNIFTFGSYFERRDKPQPREFPSSVTISCNQGVNKLRFTYRGEPSDGVPAIAREAQSIIEGSALMVADSLKATSDSLRCVLSSTTPGSVALLFRIMERLGSGKVFGHYWSASMMGVDEENVNKHGFELYNRVAQSGLTADQIKVVFKLRFLDMRGLDVVRQLCEGKTNYTIPLGAFRHRKKKAILGVFTNKDGHRLSLALKDAPTEEEWAHLESTLGTTFDRKPFA